MSSRKSAARFILSLFFAIWRWKMDECWLLNWSSAGALSPIVDLSAASAASGPMFCLLSKFFKFSAKVYLLVVLVVCLLFMPPGWTTFNC